MPRFVKHAVLVTAVAAALAAGGANAQSYVMAGGEPLRAGDGQCWRTGYWTAEIALKPVSYATQVLFAFDEDALRPEARKQLDELAQKLVAMEIDRVVAVGYTDGVGSPDYNKRLSARRAKAVGDYLGGKGVSGERMQLVAMGEHDSVTRGACASTGLEEPSDAKLIACLQPDRRVKVELIGRQKAGD